MSEIAEQQTQQSIYTADLPDDLMESAIQQLNKVGAYVDSGGDPIIMGSIHEKPSMLAFVGLTLVLGLIAYVISEIANYYEIRQNWEKYRCQPSIAPFAKFYGHDVTETLNFCAAEAVKEHAPGVIAPIYEGVNKMIGVVDGVYQKAEAIEGGITGLIGGFSNFVTNFANSLGLIGTRIRMSIVRIKDIFMRLYGSFIAFVYAGISAITFGNNLICNPLVTFVAGFAGVDLCCFAPGTRVRRADGRTVAIESVVIGTELAGGACVSSTYTFDGTDTKMVRLHGIHVSGNHYVTDPSTSALIHAAAHPAAVPAESLPVIYCLATTTNTIPVVSPTDNTTHEFADYEESYDPAVIATTQAAVETALNGSNTAVGPTIADYSLGLDPTLTVSIQGGHQCAIADLRLGDVLEGSRRVMGLVREVCEEACIVPGTTTVVSAAQLIHWGGRWQRAGNIWAAAPATDPPRILVHMLLAGNKSVIVESSKGLFSIRDYAEHEDDAIVQTAYDQAVTMKKVTMSLTQM
jgi:hypothetical protein